MYYIKNLTSGILPLPDFGIELNPGEIRDLFSFTNRSKLQDCSSVINDLIYQDKIILTDADFNHLSKVDCIQITSNAYTKVIITEDNSKNNSKYYFVTDEFRIDSKKPTVIKQFMGSVETLRIVPSNPVTVTITTGDGIILPSDSLIKRQTLEYDFNSKIKDISIKFERSYSTSDIEIFIDGTSTKTVQEIQNFIDNWRE